MAEKAKNTDASYQNADDMLICLPGDRLCRQEDNIIVGQGTYEQGGYIYASKSGIINIDESSEKVNILIYVL